MKRVVLALALSLGMIGGVACHKNTPAAPIPGQINTFDGTAYRTLMDAQAAINSVRNDVASGKLILTAAQRNVFNQIIADYNTANALWQTYHAGATNNAQALTSAINQLVVDISTISNQFKGGQ